jgi:hypothetical protein
VAIFGDIFGGIFSKQRPRQAEDTYYTERPWWWPEGVASFPQPSQPVVVWPLAAGGDRNNMESWLLRMLGLMGGEERRLEPPPVNWFGSVVNQVPLWWLSMLRSRTG